MPSNPISSDQCIVATWMTMSAFTIILLFDHLLRWSYFIQMKDQSSMDDVVFIALYYTFHINNMHWLWCVFWFLLFYFLYESIYFRVPCTDYCSIWLKPNMKNTFESLDSTFDPFYKSQETWVNFRRDAAAICYFVLCFFFTSKVCPVRILYRY